MSKSKYELRNGRKSTPVKFNVSDAHVLIGERKLIRRNIIGVHHEISKNPDESSTTLRIFYYPIDVKPKKSILDPREVFEVRINDTDKSRNENENEAENIKNKLIRDQIKLFIIVNPFSGKRKGGKVAAKLKIILDEAEVSYKLIETTHAGHAEELATKENFDGYSAIVTVSGDGLVNEVVNGLKSRKDDHTPPLAPIPAGSGNGLVMALMERVSGEHSLLSKSIHSLLLATKSSQRSIGLMKVDFNETSRFSFMAVALGLIADVDIDSERLRCLGGAVRNLIYGGIYIVRKKEYSLTIEIDGGLGTKGKYIGAMAAIAPYLDERVKFFPEMINDPGMYIQHLKTNITRCQLLKMWDLAEDGGKHVEVYPELANTKVSTLKIICEQKELFTIDGEALHAKEIFITELKSALEIFY